MSTPSFLRSETLRAICLLAALLVVMPTIALALTPGQINYQGLLLDDLGQPLTDTVDLHFEIFDDPTAGSSLWTETHANVEVTDGLYDATLGATTPITSAVLEPAAVYLEVTVDGETLTPRQRLLAVPYALVSRDTEQVSGVSSLYFQQIFEHVNYDGGGPPNDDPTEGLADSDGDGVPNFLDADNDDDGLDDETEVANGSDLNLVTPSITGLSPQARVGDLIVVSGSQFEPGMTLTVSGQVVAAQNVTPTQFEFVAANPTLNAPTPVVVELANGETAEDSLVLVEGWAFISAAATNGANLGLAEGDALCASEAATAGLTGSFVAWLSTSTTDAATRVGAGPWSRRDGAIVALDLADLTDGEIDVPIDLTAAGTAGAPVVITGTDEAGLATPNTCADWTFASGFATGALVSDVSNWSAGSGASLSCGTQWRIYCFQAP